jgi:protein-S-isoprenylcysteine O-methyltransferase Ste14
VNPGGCQRKISLDDPHIVVYPVLRSIMPTTDQATEVSPLRVAWMLIRRILIFAVLVFLPAWTWDFWQAWLFLTIFFSCECILVIRLKVNDPALLQRRLKMGFKAETRFQQKWIMRLAGLSFVSFLIVSGLDHRYGWSHLSVGWVFAAYPGIICGFILTHHVFKANSFAAATVQVTAGQQVIATGPYAVVRHPMYVAAFVMNLCIPVALGSWWALGFPLLNCGLIILRLLDEEKMLRSELPGYPDYCAQVRYRLVPGLW